MSSVTYKINIDWKKLEAGVKNELRKELGKALVDEEFEIQDRTRSGRDANERPFAPYSPSYALQKARGGRGVDAGRTSPGKRKIATKSYGKRAPVNLTVDLTLTGNMLQSTKTRVEDTGDSLVGTIDFNDTASVPRGGKKAARAKDKARWANNGTTKAPKRKFFAFSKKQRERVVARLRNALNLDAIRKALRSL